MNQSDTLWTRYKHRLKTVRKRSGAFRFSPNEVPLAKFTYFSINEVIRQVIELKKPAWSSGNKQSCTGIGLKTSLHWVPPIHAHYDSLKEVVTSLVNNAVAALPEGGTVSLRTSISDGEVLLEVADEWSGD